MALTQVISGMDGAGGGGGGIGDVIGPGSATDNALVRFDGATGKIIQNSLVILNDTGSFTSNTDHLSTLIGPQFAFEFFSLTGLAQPNLQFDPTNYGAIQIASGHGGLSITGLSNNGKNGLTFIASVGSIVATDPALFIAVYKADGAGGIQALSASEICYEVNNGGIGNVFDLYGNGACSINGASWTAQSRLNIKAPSYNAGTGTITNGATPGLVVGTATLFTIEVDVGDKIISSGSPSNQGATVIEITDNTHLKVDYPSVWGAGTNFSILKPVVIGRSAGNEVNWRIYPNGDFYGSTVHATDAGSLIALSAPGFPKLGFGFLDDTLNHTFRTAGGGNQDLILDVFGTTGGVAAHWFGINGLFKTGYGAVIGDNTFGSSSPANGLYVNGAVTIGTASPSAVAKLQVDSITQGFLPPRMTTGQRTAIAATEGLIVEDVTIHGFFGYDGTNWVQF